MLKSYSGRSHEVITSVGLKYEAYEKVVMNTTTVYFAPMSDAEIHHYLATGDYQDKAGGYGIQSPIAQFIYKVEGCFYSVMGLPLNTVRELLVEVQTVF
jgi:septum formation protein